MQNLGFRLRPSTSPSALRAACFVPGAAYQLRWVAKLRFATGSFGSHRKLILDTGGANANIRTYYSHGARECSDHILGQMAKHLCLTRAQLDALVDCKMSGGDYVKILRDLGEL